MNFYAQVIAILQDKNIDFTALVFEIAKQSPAAIVKAKKSMSGESKWEKEARELISRGLIINAIKLCRAHTGCGLMDAKKTIDKMRGL